MAYFCDKPLPVRPTHDVTLLPLLLTANGETTLMQTDNPMAPIALPIVPDCGVREGLQRHAEHHIITTTESAAHLHVAD